MHLTTVRPLRFTSATSLLSLSVAVVGVASALAGGCSDGGGQTNRDITPGLTDALMTPSGGECVSSSDSTDLLSVVRDGPFSFEVGLYADETLVPRGESAPPSSTSDIRGVGWRGSWTYSGAEIGPVNQGYGPIDSISEDIPALKETTLTTGESGGHPLGGIALPSDAQLGERFGYGVRLDLAGDSYAAGVFFTLEGTSEGGLAACQVSIASGWPLVDSQ